MTVPSRAVRRAGAAQGNGVEAAFSAALCAFYAFVALGGWVARRRGWWPLAVVHLFLAVVVTIPVLLTLVGATVGWGWTFTLLIAVTVEILVLVGELLVAIFVRLHGTRVDR